MAKSNGGINNNWLREKWRPYTAVIYMAICVCDFILFPILWSILQAFEHGTVTTPWSPITLQGGGLIHVSFGAILTAAAHGRSKEKIAGVVDNTNASAPLSLPNSIDTMPVTPTIPAVPVQINDKGQAIIPQAPQPPI